MHCRHLKLWLHGVCDMHFWLCWWRFGHLIQPFGKLTEYACILYLLSICYYLLIHVSANGFEKVPSIVIFFVCFKIFLFNPVNSSWLLILILRKVLLRLVADLCISFDNSLIQTRFTDRYIAYTSLLFGTWFHLISCKKRQV